MNREAKYQYMQTLRERYLRGNKKEKGLILDEYCRNTGQERKYAGKKFRYKNGLRRPEQRKKRKEYYDGYVRTVLAKIWGIFDYTCGQRLKTILNQELDRLRSLGEVSCSDEIAGKLKKISPAEINRSLKN